MTKNGKRSFIIGTRPSALALWQANHVKALLEERFGVAVVLKKITTKGDKVLDRSLVEIGGKGLFLKEIEDELLAGSIDAAVHSLKDVPYELPAGLRLVAILPREDAFDAWLSRGALRPEELPEGALVGTTSLRRRVQLARRYPKLVFRDLRGNVDTRIGKLDAGEFGGIVLAAAGLNRLGLAHRVTERLDLIPAAGQGAIGVECRAGDAAAEKIFAALNDEATARCVALERAFLKAVQGSCQVPVGCHVEESGTGGFSLRCFLAEPDGSNYREESAQGPWADAERAVAAAARKILT